MPRNIAGQRQLNANLSMWKVIRRNCTFCAAFWGVYLKVDLRMDQICDGLRAS